MIFSKKENWISLRHLQSLPYLNLFEFIFQIDMYTSQLSSTSPVFLQKDNYT